MQYISTCYHTLLNQLKSGRYALPDSFHLAPTSPTRPHSFFSFTVFSKVFLQLKLYASIIMQPVPSLFLTHSAVQGGPDVCWTREPAFGSGCEPRRGGMRRKSKKESACTRKNTTLEAIPGLINMCGYAPATRRPPVYGVENVRVTTSSFSSCV